jgi:hypothetical protein
VRSVARVAYRGKVWPALIVPSYFPAQNCGWRGCIWNRSICAKLQDRTDLKLTPTGCG